MSYFDPKTSELYVAYISPDATEQDVKTYFETTQGTRVVHEAFFVSRAKPEGSKKSTQVAVVRFGSHHDALDAKLKLNRAGFRGNTLVVRWSQSQRVLWVGRLHDTVTNEQLQSAFSQFGPVERACVVADPQKGASKCYGFVVFANKRDATKALQKAQVDPFLIGPTLKPVKVDYARLEDADEGYGEDLKQNKKGSARQIDASSISRFPNKGSQEHNVSSRLAALEAEYSRLKVEMKKKLLDLQNQILMTSGPVPAVGLLPSLAQDPSFGGGYLMALRAPAQVAVPAGFPGVPRPAAPPPSAPPQPVARPLSLGPKPPPGNPPGQPTMQGMVPGPRPPPGGPPNAYPHVSSIVGMKRPGDVSGHPPAKTVAVDYGSTMSTAPGQQPTMVQALTYATQQAPDPYASYPGYANTAQPAQSPQAQPVQYAMYPQVTSTSTQPQYQTYDPNQYLGSASTTTATYPGATVTQAPQQPTYYYTQ